MIEKQKIDQTLEVNYMPYAMSVIISRAIPEIDGLKPSHRKLLYTMYKMGLLKGNKTKSANVVGQTMKLNPHGDTAIYETMVRLTRGNEALLHPFVDSKGNFGKQYSRDMAYAAPRYTEVKLEKIANELFKDIDKDTVDFIDNYDSTMKEPRLLPVTFPNILTNVNQGIAVGMASNIASFNLKEICEATIALLEDEKCQIYSYISAPDFPSGAEVIYDPDIMKKVIDKGRGSFKIRSKYRYDKKNRMIEIFEIPYTTTEEAIIDSIVRLIKKGKIREINDIRDETDLKGLNLAIEVKKGTDIELLINKLYDSTPLEDSFSCNFNLLINGKPKVLGIRGILIEWIKFRIDCVRRRINHMLNKQQDRLHLLMGLNKILLDIDKAIRIVRGSKNDKLVIPNLMEGFSIDEIQAQFIAEIKLRNLNKEYILNKTKEIESLEESIEKLKKDFKSDRRIKTIIKKELKGVIKEYSKDRKTQIVHVDEVVEIEQEEYIDDYNLKLFLTDHNYIKKVSLASLRGNDEHKLKNEDKIIQEIETTNKAEVLLFSNMQNVFKAKVHELEDCKASEFGKYISNILPLEEEENIIYMVVTDKYLGYMLFSYQSGKVAKIPLSSYETKTNRKKLANAYSDSSPLIDIRYLKENEDIELVAISNIHKAVVFNTSQINSKSTRSSVGLSVQKQKKKSYTKHIITLEEFDPNDDKYYRTKNIPAIGKYIKDEDEINKQLSIL